MGGDEVWKDESLPFAPERLERRTGHWRQRDLPALVVLSRRDVEPAALQIHVAPVHPGQVGGPEASAVGHPRGHRQPAGLRALLGPRVAGIEDPGELLLGVELDRRPLFLDFGVDFGTDIG